MMQITVSKEARFGHGSLLLSIVLSALVGRFLGPVPALIILIICTVVGIYFLVTAAHSHSAVERESAANRRGIMATIGVFVFVGALLGAVVGSAWIFVQKYKEGRPGPGAVLGLSGSVSTLLTPASPKRGAMTGSFTTSGRGEYEVDILGVEPEELLFQPPGKIVERKDLPTALVIDGHNILIRKFTANGFVVFDNGWRDIAVTVRVIRASMPPEQKPTSTKSRKKKFRHA